MKQSLAELAKVEQAKAQQKAKPTKANPPRASTTDPEARFMRMPDGGNRPAYNVQLAVETGSRAIVGVDVTDAGSLRKALEGVDVAYYLVHALDSTDFERKDAEAAEAFGRAAAEAGVDRIVYLGGLGRDDDDATHHPDRQVQAHIVSAILFLSMALTANANKSVADVAAEIEMQIGVLLGR